MFVPLTTDAPIYHRPLATIGLMVAMVAASILFWGLDPESRRQWVLAYGSGLHPTQWITSNFVHADPIHLIGNLIFLWGFGLIVEGKVGAPPFLALALGIGALECGVEQAIMLGADPTGGSLGASSIVFGLVAVAMVWAPHNEVHGLYWIGWRTGTFEFPIVGFAALYLGWEILMILLSGLAFGSPALHVLGAGAGFALATAFLKAGWVDCEGWDLYSKGWSGRRATGGGGGRRRKKRTGASSRNAGAVEARSAAVLDGLRASIESGHAIDALGFFRELDALADGWRPLENDLLRLIGLLQRQGLEAESVPVMEEFLARFPDRPTAPRVRLKLAQVMVREQRPVRALRLLAELPEATLADDLKPARRRVELEALRLRDEEGVLELDGP
jgi:membrane associated rhomboid family serine protease